LKNNWKKINKTFNENGLVFLIVKILIIFVTKYPKHPKKRHEFIFRMLKKEERTQNVE
jgi:hypothetical protein